MVWFLSKNGPVLAALALPLVALATPAWGSTPGDIAGLAAWYEIDSVHQRSHDGEEVDRWPDSSGKGRHLEAAGEGRRSVFLTKRLNGKPIVRVHPTSRFDVAQPFELDDHTIFLVYAADQAGWALVRSDTDPKRGIVLGPGGRFHQYESGEGRTISYNRSTVIGPQFSITTLGRDSGRLRASINGADYSSGLEMRESLRVGRFFRSTGLGSGAELQVAEVIFYDRYLAEAERANVTSYLADKYGLRVHSRPLGTPATPTEPTPAGDTATLIRLSSRSDVNVNDEAVSIGWDVVGRMARPFHFDPDTGDAAIHCDQDGMRIGLTISLSLRTETPDARVRVLILRNGQEYHPEETVSPPFAGQGAEKASFAELRTEMTLDAGDFIEVVTHREGAPGRVWLHPGMAVFDLVRIE